MSKYETLAVAILAAVVAGLSPLSYGWAHDASTSLGAAIAAFVAFCGITMPSIKAVVTPATPKAESNDNSLHSGSGLSKS